MLINILQAVKPSSSTVLRGVGFVAQVTLFSAYATWQDKQGRQNVHEQSQQNQSKSKPA